ncbi:hypothetical protein HK097_002419 [Rhizophlyctis rosea]|uniref:Uncharacterized protein n=1 Tax=Rhizophlyctis rosea TaxID=64517 RepID=A0AAD5SH46_9FUNG|nr:hypothetical protein HK097_002419 [Rhizophlyctis rosea]
MGNAASTKGAKGTMKDRLERADKTGIVTLTDAKLKEIPEKIFTIKNLKNLDLSRNKLSSIPPQLQTFTTLKFLSLSHNSLTTVPLSITYLTTLTTLNLSHNAITTLPPQLSSLTSLKTLLLSHNNLTTLPLTITSLSTLITLDVSHNNITALPDPSTVTTKLSSLEEFNLEVNKLTLIQDEWAAVVPGLKTIKLGSNTLKTFPEAILKVRSVTWIDLKDNVGVNEDELSHLDGYEEYVSRRKNRVDQFLKT